MLFVNADFPETERRAKLAARRILRKNPRQQLPPAPRLASSISAPSAALPNPCPGLRAPHKPKIPHPVIAGPGPVGESRGIGLDGLIFAGHKNRIALVEPLENLLGVRGSVSNVATRSSMP